MKMGHGGENDLYQWSQWKACVHQESLEMETGNSVYTNLYKMCTFHILTQQQNATALECFIKQTDLQSEW